MVVKMVTGGTLAKLLNWWLAEKVDKISPFSASTLTLK